MQFILLIIVLILLADYARGGVSAAPWFPTKDKERRIVLDNLKLLDGMKVYDLGCGDGRVLFDIAEKNNNISATGIDISLVQYLRARWKKYRGGSMFDNVDFIWGDLFKKDISDADIVFIFLLPKIYDRLQKKFAAELKPEALVVMSVWPFESIVPIRTIETDGALPVYLYVGAQFREERFSCDFI